MARNKPPTTLDQKWLCPTHLLLLGVSCKWWGPAACRDIHNPPLAQTGLGRGQPPAYSSFLFFLMSYFSHVPQNSMVPVQHLNRLILFLSTYPKRVIPVLTLYWRHGHSPDLEMALMVFPSLITFLIVSDRCFCFPNLTDISVLWVDWCF